MNARFPEYKGLNLPNVAEEIRNYWEEHNIFEKSIEAREGHQPFVFFEGPPSANGLPGIHHVMARAIKDIFYFSVFPWIPWHFLSKISYTC